MHENNGKLTPVNANFDLATADSNHLSCVKGSIQKPDLEKVYGWVIVIVDGFDRICKSNSRSGFLFSSCIKIKKKQIARLLGISTTTTKQSRRF